MDGEARADMEARLGADSSDVRVHDDGAAQRSAAEVGAHA
ncbi:eCIS core domain-containing protein [Streptomyces sp. B21-102]